MPDQTTKPNAENGRSEPSECRALVRMEPAQPGRGSERPQADFLAQLIACHRRMPSYRQARTAEPKAAVTAYSPSCGRASALLDRVV